MFEAHVLRCRAPQNSLGEEVRLLSREANGSKMQNGRSKINTSRITCLRTGPPFVPFYTSPCGEVRQIEDWFENRNSAAGRLGDLCTYLPEFVGTYVAKANFGIFNESDDTFLQHTPQSQSARPHNSPEFAQACPISPLRSVSGAGFSVACSRDLGVAGRGRPPVWPSPPSKVSHGSEHDPIFNHASLQRGRG